MLVGVEATSPDGPGVMPFETLNGALEARAPGTRGSLRLEGIEVAVFH